MSRNTEGGNKCRLYDIALLIIVLVLARLPYNIMPTYGTTPTRNRQITSMLRCCISWRGTFPPLVNCPLQAQDMTVTLLALCPPSSYTYLLAPRSAHASTLCVRRVRGRCPSCLPFHSTCEIKLPGLCYLAGPSVREQSNKVLDEYWCAHEETMVPIC